MADEDLISISKLPCCPEVTRSPCCDRLLFTYRLEHNLTDIPVEVAVTYELERCPGPLALGDLVYSTTLLPGEKVRLYTSNRKNRFTFDSESQVSYRHEQTSEETFYMNSMDRFLSDSSGGAMAVQCPYYARPDFGDLEVGTPIIQRFDEAEKNEVIIGRNQLVEIGGGFRVPEIMETSGAKLRPSS